MSVDKFGRYSDQGIRLGSNAKGIGLSITPGGDYDIGNKRLKFVEDPEDSKDAVNLQTLKSNTYNSLKIDDTNNYNCRMRKLKEVGAPDHFDDAVNVNYIVRVLSEIFFDFYNLLVINKPKINKDQKDEWIKSQIVQKYFINPQTRKFRSFQ
jgi:hypothetical protein